MPSAVSVKSVRFILALALASSPAFASSPALASSPAFAALQEVPVPVPLPDEKENLELDPPPETRPEIEIIVVGRELSAAALERVLGPELQSHYSLRFESAPRFSQEELFRERPPSSTRFRVWVDTSHPGRAQLYFANREGTRYLVRTFELSDSLDEMDREALAQAIEWSLQALVEGTEGLTREEAEALLSKSSEPSLPPAPAEPARENEPSKVSWRRGTPGWLPEVALLHRWVPHSAEMPAAQGPVLQFGLDRVTVAHQFGVAVSVQYQYPQRYSEEGVAIEIQSLASRIDARYLATKIAQGSGLGLRIGFGIDAVFSSPEALDEERFEAEENQMSTIPLVTSGLIWQLQVESRVRLEFSLGAEFDLVATHYDIVTEEGTKTLLSRWPVRPSLSVGIALF